MNTSRSMLISASILGLFAIAGTLLVALTHDTTREQVQHNQRAFTLMRLHELIPPQLHDNDMDRDTIVVSDPLLGSKQPVTVYRARKDNQPVAAIVQAIAPDGYSGRLVLLVAIRMDGTLAGVRVVDHQETPGLGDAIDARKSGWILQFAGRSLDNPPAEQWKVKRDNGSFDQITSATITSRAVVKAVYNCIVYFNSHRDELFATRSAP